MPAFQLLKFWRSTSEQIGVGDANILAIFTSTGALAASDYLANTGVTYLNPSARGLESVDSVGINTGNAMRLDVDFRASSPGDFVRVLTEKSPIAERMPDSGATAALLLVSFAGLCATRRLIKR